LATGNPTATFSLGDDYLLFNATSTAAGLISILESNPGNSYGEVDMNGLQISGAFSSVPEPTTILTGALMLLPFGANGMRKIRRKLTA
jgi:hypothetical protein